MDYMPAANGLAAWGRTARGYRKLGEWQLRYEVDIDVGTPTWPQLRAMKSG